MSRLTTMGILVFIMGVQTLSAQYPFDESFGEKGICYIDRAEDMIVLSNGNILVFDSKDPNENIINVLGFDADGKALQSFGENGVLKLQFEKQCTFRMAIGAEHNEWYMWVYNYNINNTNDSVIRFNAEGKRIKEYGINGAVALPIKESYKAGNMLVLRSGELMVTGEFVSAIPNTYGRFVYKYTTTGVLDQQFGDGGLVMLNDYNTFIAGRSIFVERSDGKIIVGNTVTFSIYIETHIILLNKFGVPDTSFGEQGRVTLSAGIGDCSLSSYWYDDRSEVLYCLTYGAYFNDVRVWQINWDGEFNELFGSNGYKKNGELNGAKTIYKMSNGTFLYTGSDYINYHFQWDIAVWKTTPDLIVLPWPSKLHIPSVNLQETEDLGQASDDHELCSIMCNDGSILILADAKLYNDYDSEYPDVALIKLNVREELRPDLCPLLSVPVLYADQVQSSFLLTLDPQASGSFTFSITDMLGRTVVPHYTLNLEPGLAHYTYPIPQDLPKGMYLLTIHADDCATGIKFVK